MQTYVVHVYRARQEDSKAIAGVIEDVASGQKEAFNGLNHLHSKLTHSIEHAQLELKGLVPEESIPFSPAVMSR